MEVRNPTWASLTPSLPDFIQVEPGDQADLYDVIKKEGNLYHVLFDGNKNNAFLFRGADSQTQIFIRAIKAEAHNRCKLVEDFVGQIRASDYVVNRATQVTENSNSTYIYYCYPHYGGRRLRPTSSDVRALGAALAKLHRALESHPMRDTICEKSMKRERTIQMIQEKIASGYFDELPYLKHIKSLTPKNLQFAQHPQQVVHGDLNMGNLLYTNNQICFFDFEDSIHNYQPVLFDLSFVIERLIYSQTVIESERLILGRQFIASYKDHGGKYEYQNHDETYLELLSFRALCLLVYAQACGKDTLQTEWEKFITLSEQARNCINVTKSILQGAA